MKKPNPVDPRETARSHAGDLIDEGLRQHLLRVYNCMGLGLVVTGLVAYTVGTTPALFGPIFSTPLKWAVILAPLAFGFFFSFRMQSISASGAQTMFWAFCAVMGLSLASVFLVFTGTSIARTFFIAATMFGATSLYGYGTNRDLSQFGSFLIMGLIGMVIAGVVNLFLGSTAVQFAISVIGILVSVGLTAWDTQAIKEQYAENFEQEPQQKLAVFGAFSLYLNLINIFQLLLTFTGQREEGSTRKCEESR
ncbi:Bax inhibitor-1/YccA family protein [Mesorhizobium sp. M1216]|uniref:Bax inhibitor-1/YccA family protein n=1 Tax=Mesorhizobium sp. M1216 TaxID=2957069 RepID=UPI003336F6A9